MTFEAGPLGALEGATLEGLPGGRHVVVRSGDGARQRFVSPMLEVLPSRSYTLSWRQTLVGVPAPTRADGAPAGVSVRFFAAPKGIENPEGWIQQGDNKKSVLIRPPKRGWWRPAEGNSPAWEDRTEVLQAPPEARYVEILVRAGGGKGAGSRIGVDDLTLSSAVVPPWLAQPSEVWAEDGRPDLLRRVRVPHPAHAAATEVRDAVLAPAPSTLTTRLRVPEGARLDLGCGLLPGAAGASVRFEVSAQPAGGEPTTLVEVEASGAADEPWQDLSADLSPYAGQEITLRLTTSRAGDSTEPPDAVAASEARAVWTSARLEPSTSTGRLAVLVIVDTLGARHASGWGGERETTPHLQRIAAAGTHYEQARAPAPWTLPSIASYLSGLHPDEHGAGDQRGRDHWARQPLSRSVDTLAERLQRAGWDTRAWANNAFLTSHLGQTDQGFARYVDIGTRLQRRAGLPAVEAALGALDRSAGDRFVLLHLMDPHGPYRPDEAFMARFVDPSYDGPLKHGTDRAPWAAILRGDRKASPEDRKHLVDLHEAAIAWTDAQVGRVYDAARATGQDVLFVVVSDHGEEFWEHGRTEHGHSLYDELLHVPLAVHRAGQTPGRVTQPVDAAGLFGTILDFAGLEGPDGLPTASTDDAVFGSPTLYGVRQRSVTADGWKYILRQPRAGRRSPRVRKAPLHQLFELGSDPTEQNDRAAEEPARAAALHRTLIERALVGFPGAWLVHVGAGKDSVELTMTGGGGWHADVHEFPWPAQNGKPWKPRSLSIERTTTEDASTIRLDVRRSPTLLVVQPRGEVGTVTVSPNEDVPTTITSAELFARLDGAPEDTLVARLAGDARRRDAEGPSDSDLEALRSLGYIE
jgi:arylsulfatase A-like enzyme